MAISGLQRTGAVSVNTTVRRIISVPYHWQRGYPMILHTRLLRIKTAIYGLVLIAMVQFDPQNFTIETYSTDNGLPSNQFNYKSALASSTGELFFGTLEGLISFFPERLEQNSFIPPVYITYIKHKNDEASGELYDKGTNSGYLQAKQITLQHVRIV